MPPRGPQKLPPLAEFPFAMLAAAPTRRFPGAAGAAAPAAGATRRRAMRQMAAPRDFPETPVPGTWEEVQTTFLRHPSGYAPLASIGALGVIRLQAGPATIEDGAVAVAVVAFWLLQEWVVHRYLLHSSWDWMGRAIHLEHHQAPYFHVSLDSPALILGVMALAGAVFYAFWGLALGQPQLAATATAAYYAAGVLYEFAHYVVHTRWTPPPGWRGAWLRAVRRHHMLHHMRNEAFWLSFTVPSVDAVFGTLPGSAASVPLTPMARRAHGAAAAAAAGAAAAAAGEGEGEGSRAPGGSGAASAAAAAAGRQTAAVAAGAQR